MWRAGAADRSRCVGDPLRERGELFAPVTDVRPFKASTIGRLPVNATERGEQPRYSLQWIVHHSFTLP